jgi:hypothetical protein
MSESSLMFHGKGDDEDDDCDRVSRMVVVGSKVEGSMWCHIFQL